MSDTKYIPNDTLPSAKHSDGLPDAVYDSEAARDTLPVTKPSEHGQLAPDTLHVCEPCDGNGCSWCDDGWQSKKQYRAWCSFRSRMRNISNTYSFVDAIVVDVLERLNKMDTDQALVLALEGQRLLEKWNQADPVNRGRDKATEALKAYNKRALDYLLNG